MKRTYKRITVFLLIAVMLLALFPISASAACAHTPAGTLWCDTSHPHYTFRFCSKCGAAIYTGGSQYKSNCAICNPALNCKHTGSKWTDPSHPHPTYCQTCSALISSGTKYSGCSICYPHVHSYSAAVITPATCTTSGVMKYTCSCGASYTSTISALGHNTSGQTQWCEATHPHYTFNYCLRCNVKVYDGGTKTKDNCAICNPALNCTHTGSKWTDPSHPHPTYCQVCSTVVNQSTTYAGCPQCAATQTSVSISVSGPLDAISDSGILSIEAYPAVFSISANVKNGSLKSLTYSGPGGSGNISNGGGFIIMTKAQLGTYTITASSAEGAVKTISANIKFQTLGVGDIRWRTAGMNIKSVFSNTGSIIKSGLNTYIKLLNGNAVASSEDTKIANLIGLYDGKAYTLNGSYVVEVIRVSTGAVLGSYDVVSDWDNLTSRYGWGSATLADFSTMKAASITYQTPKAVNATAVFCNNDKSIVFGTVTAQQAGAPAYVFPYETTSINFSTGMVSVSSEYTYHGLQWVYSPIDSTHINGSQPGLPARSEVYNFTTPSITYYFYYDDPITTGSITVNAVNASTGASIPSAQVTLAGQTGSSGTVFSKLSFGTYSATASASGYYNGNGSATISRTSPNATITIYLTPIITTGDVTVYVKDSSTGSAIQGASVSVAGRSGNTNSSGVFSVSSVSFGTYTATASASGYISGSKSGTISQSNPSASITIYLDKIPPNDLIVSAISPTTYKGGQTVLTMVTVGVSNVNILPGDNVTVRLSIPELSITKDVTAIVISNGGTNLAIFSWVTPNVTINKSITLTATVDPNNIISESNESNNTKSVAAVIRPVIYDPPKEYQTYPTAPARTDNDYITWTEQRYENGTIVNKPFWARLTVTATLNYNTIGQGYMRSGYGFTISVKPVVTTNYDRPELITGAQTSEVYLPQYRYIDAISLITSQTRTSPSNTYYFAPNPASPYNSNKQFVPVWWRDSYEYVIQSVCTDAYTPGGTLTAWLSGSNYSNLKINIEGSMYDDDTTGIR